ncbi:MAG: ATP-dependent 6-phosphofructokinase [Flavobacteriales bacterium]|nr:ATP-dependent 6-phosphofructokinase [Flavobacteriales bacterium]
MKVCVLTGGGDAPGLNAVLRGFAKRAAQLDIEPWGSPNGFEGLVFPDVELQRLDGPAVRGILPRGGSILGCSNKSNPFAMPVPGEKGKTRDESARVVERIRALGLDALVLVGGDGTMHYARRFISLGVPCVGVPKTIDNDLAGTDRTIGFDTACNTAMEAIDRLRDTASSHERLFFVEVMGRDAGFIALRTAIAGGAEYAMVPEAHQDIDDVVRVLTQGAQGKGSSIVVVAEGDEQGGAFAIAQRVKERAPQFDIRVSVLGHLQRGGSPTVADRVLAGRLGVGAVEHLCAGHRHGVLGTVNGKLTLVPFAEAIAGGKPAETELLRILPILSV